MLNVKLDIIYQEHQLVLNVHNGVKSVMIVIAINAQMVTLLTVRDFVKKPVLNLLHHVLLA